MSLDERNALLDKKITEHPIEQTVQALEKTARQNRRRIMILMISVILDIVLTISVTILAYHTSKISHLAQTNRAAVVANCETSNEGRKDNKDLWDFAFPLPTDQAQTAEQAANLKSFRAKVNETFAQRNCQAEINKQ